MTHEYTTRGVCARKILFEVKDGKVHNVQFISGCSGNTQGIAKLCEGMDVNEVIDRLEGIRGFMPQRIPFMRPMASRAGMPIISEEIPCKLPLQPPSTCTLRMIPSSTST